MDVAHAIEPIPYATIAPRRPSAWPGVAILFGGLGLIVLGGCFLIGAMMTINGTGGFQPGPPPAFLTSAQTLFVVTMYLLAVLCFAGAAILVWVGVRSLVRLMAL